MSVRHPNIRAWQRDGHDGVYTSSLAGFTMRVRWTPNTPETRGSFGWTVEREGMTSHHSHDRFEEIEAAMADAEAFVCLEGTRLGIALG